MYYEIHAMVELSFFLSKDKERISSLSSLEEIHHMNLSLDAITSVKLEILIYSLSIVLDDYFHT